MPTTVLLRSLVLTVSVTMAFTFAYFYSVRRAVGGMQPLTLGRQGRPWIAAETIGQRERLVVQGFGFTPLGAVELYAEGGAASVRWVGTARASREGEFRLELREPAEDSRLLRAVDQATRDRGATHPV